MFVSTVRQRAGLGMFVLVLSIAGLGGVAQAALTDHSGAFHGCVGSRGALRVISPTHHCAHGETAISFSGQGEVKALKTRVAKLETKNTALTSRVGKLESTLTGVARSGNTLKFTGMNLQLLSGNATDAAVNGLGNLIIGYNAHPGTQTGSHNLILGGYQTFTSVGGIDAGNHNTISSPGASVTGGYNNTANAYYASVTGGGSNTASGDQSSVTGGNANTASGNQSSVTGGGGSTASGLNASVTGGNASTASGFMSSVTGGNYNTASGFFASVTGGNTNTADGNEASVSGGNQNTAHGTGSSVLGGLCNNLTVDDATTYTGNGPC